ncbi:hypothetical protein BDV96DRAFT_565044 [Lophiotrema nucula]|uniref:Chitinase n=1 Tax=Lophiotrema nucula TaxID=690887 RepID=A0A6A5ZMS5_9PLEO|nr:hypothetical protein BDV96DRAFT_565044 [Lophiotrema nucula]
MLSLLFTVVLSFCLRVQAATVFAHFMISNTGNYNYQDFVDDISKAQEAHIDGFALNIGW